MTRNIALTVAAVFLFSHVAHAAMPLKALKAKQKAAGDFVEFTALNVKTIKHRKNDLDVIVDAKITKVNRAKSNVKVGQKITIKYWNPKPGVKIVGDWPPQLKKGKHYWGYLNQEGPAIWVPAANSMSFGETKQSKDAKPIALTFKCFGGFAGFHDDLTVYNDFTFVSKAPRHVPHMNREGKLTDAQQATLKKLIATYGKVNWKRSNGPRVADGMDESITINGTGKKTKLNPRDAEFGTISKLAHEVITKARKIKPKVKPNEKKKRKVD